MIYGVCKNHVDILGGGGGGGGGGAKSIDTIDYVHRIGNTPTHSIENVLFQRGTTVSSLLFFVKF